MMSIGKVSSGASAANYYEGVDDYYRDGGSPSFWAGNAAREIGLNGAVDSSQFRELLDGKMPDGSSLHNAAEGRRAGTDLTLSAPKSVSIAALVLGDERLVAAHEAAVGRTLDYVETLAAYRETINGETKTVHSGNLIAAVFRHDLSRAGDPALHSHSVLINATQRSDGAWRSMEISSIYQQQKLIGALYRSELALEVKKLGYEIDIRHCDGRFELKGYSAAQLDAFSQRGKAIEQALEALGKNRDSASAKEKEMVALSTRDAKTSIDRESLREQWKEKAQTLGINISERLPEKQIEPDHVSGAKAAVTDAVGHLIERQAVVSENRIIETALQFGVGTTDLQSIQNELTRQVESGEVLKSGDRFTTQLAQNREREMLVIEQRGRGAVSSIMNSRSIDFALSNSTLNDGQKGAAAMILTTENRFSAVQGYAGTGKTTLLKTSEQVARVQGYAFVGVAPSAAAAHELSKANIQSQTIAGFLAKEKSGLTNKHVLIVDEAGMVSAKDLNNLLKTVEAAGARAVLLGDTQQIKAVEAGRPFAQLQEAGIAKVEMVEIQRQKDAELLQAVKHAANRDVVQAVKTLEPNIKQVDDSMTRFTKIANEYSSLSRDERKNTLVLAGTNNARLAINEFIRAELGLRGQGADASVLIRKDLTNTQARMSSSYAVGDYVKVEKRYESLGLGRGDLAKVVSVSAGMVELVRQDGKVVDWRIAIHTHMSAYVESHREFSVGESIRATANDYAKGVLNGDKFEVTKIDTQSVTAINKDGKEISFDLTKPQAFEYGYCSTVHSAQGQTVERVIIEADTRSLTSNESTFYVAISRATDNVSIYTDDKSMLVEAMSRDDFKDAALDLNTSPNKESAAEKTNEKQVEEYAL